MPRAKPDAKENIQIELHTPNRSHVVAGDVLTGLVTLKAGTKIPVDHVKLTLFGRTKTKISRKNANNITSVYRGRRLFFEKHQDLSAADIVCTSDAQAWPFSIAIPESPAPSQESGDPYKPEPGYWSTEVTANNSNYSFPSTYYYFAEPGAMSTTTAEAYVEYALKVEFSNAKLSNKHYGATALAFRGKSIELPLTDFDFKERKFPVWIKSEKLLPPPSEKPVVSTRDSFIKMFKSNPKPKYGFGIMVHYPTMVQLEHPASFPLRMEVIPDLKSGNTTISPDMLPDVKLVSMSLTLIAFVIIRSPSTFSTTESRKERKYKLVTDYKLDHVIPNRQFAAADGSLPELLDIGDILKLSVNRRRPDVPGVKSVDFERPLVPSFSTYNIQLRYQLRWKMFYECGGKRTDISHEVPVVVHGPSEADVKDKESSWVGTERGKDYDEIENGVEIAMQGLNALANILSM
ncbi:hypothetical protein PVAG01_10225 [Phlyctema vagabunda]|uniref:Arrestin-like N-terminal domain-containing protein n=1 Tax=Phlyctema vagabunda TaxID=108571 RepID=A0ABR4P5C3_9HELO